MRQFKPTGKVIKTDNFTSSLKKFFGEINGLSKISPERELELIPLVKRGDKKALKELMGAHYPFVISVAKKYEGLGTPLNDLINEGALGLNKAIYRFDITRGFRLLSYAVWSIQQRMIVAIHEYKNFVKLPENKIDLLKKINKIIEQSESLAGRSNCEINSHELAEKLNVGAEAIEEMKRYPGRVISLSEPTSSWTDFETLETKYSYPGEKMISENTSDKNLNLKSLNTDILRSLDTLTPLEKKITLLFFGINLECFRGSEMMDYYIDTYPFGLPLEEIAIICKLTRERVRQIKEKAIRRMKHTSRSRILKKYLCQ